MSALALEDQCNINDQIIFETVHLFFSTLVIITFVIGVYVNFCRSNDPRNPSVYLGGL